MLQRLRNYATLAWNAIKNQVGAQSIVNDLFSPGEASFLPAAHTELADQTLVAGTLTTAVVNTGVVGLQWLRLRLIVKSLGTTPIVAGEIVQVTVQAGTGAAVTNPVNIGQRAVRMITGDTMITLDLMCWSNAGFQSYQINVQTLVAAGTISNTKTPVFDAFIDCA